MEFEIIGAEMEKSEDGYIGKVQFIVKGHKVPYEITLHSKKGRDWGYSLHFLHESGLDEQIDSVDEYLEQDDEAFERLVQAAQQAQV